MLRNFLIYISKANWARRIVMRWSFARITALRFVAGESLEEAIAVARKLNKAGMNVTLDLLGEDVQTGEEASLSVEMILNSLDQIESEKVRAGVSIKLSQLGLTIDENLCQANLVKILSKAAKLNSFVRIDMEDSSTIDATLRQYDLVKAAGFDNVGLVVQSYLYRSADDVRALLENDTRIRIVKGAYQEPHDIAFAKKSDADAEFDKLSVMLLDKALNTDIMVGMDGKYPPIAAIATHDEARIEFAKNYAEEIGLDKNKLEFQMLYGIRRSLQQQLVEQAFPVRIYVPFGTEWFPYFMRRLAERPANLWFFVRSLIAK